MYSERTERMLPVMRSMAKVGDDGELDLGMVDTYAELLGMSLDDADIELEHAVDELVREEVLIDWSGILFVREVYENWLENERAEEAAWAQYIEDARRSYYDNCI